MLSLMRGALMHSQGLLHGGLSNMAYAVQLASGVTAAAISALGSAASTVALAIVAGVHSLCQWVCRQVRASLYRLVLRRILRQAALSSARLLASDSFLPLSHTIAYRLA